MQLSERDLYLLRELASQLRKLRVSVYGSEAEAQADPGVDPEELEAIKLLERLSASAEKAAA